MSAATAASCARTWGTPGDTHMYSEVPGQLPTCGVITPVVKFFVLTLHSGCAFSQFCGVLVMNWLQAALLPEMKPVYAFSQACTSIPCFAASASATTSGSCAGRAPPSVPHMRGEQGSRSE